MKKRIIIFILFATLMTRILPSQEALAIPPLVDCAIKYKVPKDFIWWMHNKKHSGPEQNEFIKAYREEQGYLLAPNPYKKKNKVSKKNAILHATLQNPSNQDFTYTKLYLYDKKEKRYRIFLRKKVAEKSKRKEKVALKFNVLKIIKDRRNRFLRKKKSFFPLKRKKKYKYMIRTKVNGTYLEAKGTFQLK